MDVMNVDTTIVALTGAIGAERGSTFTFNAAQGRYASIKAIEVWAGPDRINGFAVETTDADKAMAGKAGGPSKRFEFHVGERISTLSLWGNGEGAYLGAIKFRTSEGREFDFGMTSWGRKTEYPMQVASGIMAGIFGMQEADGIRGLGFIFYRTITASYMSDMEFPEEALAQVRVTPRNVITENVSNDTDQTQTTTLAGSYTVSERNDVGYAGDVTVEGTFNVEVGLAMKTKQPKFEPTETSKHGGSIKVSTTQGGTNAYGVTKTSLVQYAIPVTVPPRSQVSVSGIVYDTEAHNLKFTAQVHLDLDSGARITLPISGYYSGVDATALEVEFKKV